jgi:hypothetical protein
MQPWQYLHAALLALVLASPSTAQCTSYPIPAPVPRLDGEFGRVVETHGEWVFVGSPLDETVGIRAGVVDVFRVDGSGAQHVQRLFPSNQTTDMVFGWSLDADDGRLVVGAPYSPVQFNQNQTPTWPGGAVYVFEEFGGTWTETQLILPAGLALGDEFGVSVAIQGTHMLIGARRDDQLGQHTGKVYCYELSGGVYTHVQTVLGHPTQWAFGSQVRIEGNYCGIRGESLPPVYQLTVFEWTGAQWSFVRYCGAIGVHLIAALAEDFDFDGHALVMTSVTEDHPSGLTEAGALYYYPDVRNPNSAPVKIWAAIPETRGLFGAGVEFEAGTITVTGRPSSQTLYSDYVARYRQAGGVWQEIEHLTEPSTLPDDHFGDALDVQNGRIVVGAPKVDGMFDNQGSVWVYHRDAGFSVVCPCDLQHTCGFWSPNGGCVNSLGWSGRLAACGTAAISSDDLVLLGTGIPPNQFVLPFMGDSLIPPVVVGAGRRCAGGNAKRFMPVLVDTNGNVTIGPGLAAQSAALHGAQGIAAGTTWTFQLWYRDNSFPCSNVNMTNGLSVQFRP